MAIASIMAASVIAFGGMPLQQTAQDPGDGLAGAALCVAAADHLVTAGETGNEEEALSATWRHIMTAITADASVRDAAMRRARSGIEAAEAERAGAGGIAARGLLNMACRDEAAQLRYLQRYGKPELMSPGAG